MALANGSIIDRLLGCFPSGHYCLPALFRLLQIVETTSVPTACVECLARPRMLVNPDFVGRHAATSEKLLMLVLHELHHVILGHTRLFRRVTPIDNVVFDAVINAMLARLMPGPEHTSLFTDLYSAATFPDCLLRPPPGWVLGSGDFDVPEGLRGKIVLAGLHRELYLGVGATYSELRRALESDAGAVAGPRSPLLGDHREEGRGSSSDGGLEGRSPVLLDELRRITEQWPRPPRPMPGRSPHDLLTRDRVDVPPTNRTRLERLLRRVGSMQGEGRERRKATLAMPVTSAVPRSDRRTVVLAALGHPPLLHRDESSQQQWARLGSRVHVYVDVSGSVGQLIGPLYAAVLACGDLVHPRVHLFSTEVRDATFADLRRGIVASTGGTSIECVAAHLETARIPRAVLVTDGFVGSPGAAAAATLRSRVIGVALTPGHRTRDDLATFVDQWIELEEGQR